MRSYSLALLALPGLVACSSADAAEPRDPSFWLAPTFVIQPKPAEVSLVSVPGKNQPFALLQVGESDPSAFKVTNPLILPFVDPEGSGYQIIPGGLKLGAKPYSDRKYQITRLPDALSGLPLLQTEMIDKGFIDGRFAIVLSSSKPCVVFIAIDERAIQTYKEVGTPGWLQEFAPIGYKIHTDDPLMDQLNVGYLVFARKVPAGRISLGPACMDMYHNGMYFAFFAEAE